MFRLATRALLLPIGSSSYTTSYATYQLTSLRREIYWPMCRYHVAVLLISNAPDDYKNTPHEQLNDVTSVPLLTPCAAIYGCMQMIRHAYQLRDATPADVGPPAQALHPLACGDHNYPLFKHFPPSAVKLQVNCSMQLHHSLQACMSASRIGSVASSLLLLVCLISQLAAQPATFLLACWLACLLTVMQAMHPCTII